MAGKDGSIRIDATVNGEQAKKQLEQLTKDIERQEKAIERQEAKVQKLAAAWAKAAAGGTRGMKLKAELKATEVEAARLAAELDKVNAKIHGAQADYKGKLKQAATGAIPQEELTRSAQAMQRLVAESNRIAASLQQADDKAIKLKASLASAVSVSKQNAASKNLLGNLEAEKAKLDSMKTSLAKLNSQFYSLTSGVKANLQKLAAGAGKVKNTLANAFSCISQKIQPGLGSAIDKVKSKMSEFGKKSRVALGGVSKAARGLGVRLRDIAVGAFVFNAVSRAVDAMARGLGRALLVNQDFARSFAQIKSNLLVAFQPIYEAVMPALNALMQGLANATAYLAQFMAYIFGTTAQQAQENAEALYQQANATKENADATKDSAKATKEAEKALASFDTVQKLHNKQDVGIDSNIKPEPITMPKFDTNFEEFPLPDWVKDFWKVFQDSWAMYGQATLDTAAAAMDALKLAGLEVGKSFLEVWTNGTGLEMLNNFQLILQNIYAIIEAIALAFAAAWVDNGAGTAMLQALGDMLNSLLTVILVIGEAFLVAWNNGAAGEALFAMLFTAITSIAQSLTAIGDAFIAAWTEGAAGQMIFESLIAFGTMLLDMIRALSDTFRAAWEEGDAGVQMWAAILASVQSVIDLILLMGETLVSVWEETGLGQSIWTNIINIIQGISDFITNIADGLRAAWEENESGLRIWEAILGIADGIGKFIAEIIQKTAEWAATVDFAPLVNAIATALETVKTVLDAIWAVVSAIWENVVLPIADILIETTFPAILDFLSWIVAGIMEQQWILDGLLFLVDALGEAFNAWGEIASRVFETVMGWIKKAIDAVSQFIQKIGGKISSFFGFGGGSSTYSLDTNKFETYSINMDDIPHLASGAVISPNSEFLAVLGDQKAGTNIEAPLSTIKQALAEVLADKGNGSNAPINLYIDGQKFARITGSYNNGEAQRKGMNLITAGGI